MSFDALAPHYRWMEFVLAGNKLQACRTAFLESVNRARNVLIVGEGNGRFLCECRRRLPEAHITCVDASARMLALSAERLQRYAQNASSIEFIHSDILHWTPPPKRFDLIVTHFFLDCFSPEQLTRVVHLLASAATAQATWLLSDFQIPTARFRACRAEAIHAIMYLFFRLTTRLSARRLTVPDDVLRANGFELRRRLETEWGLLHTDEWSRRSNH